MTGVDEWFVDRIVDGDRHAFETDVLPEPDLIRRKFILHLDGTVAFA